jgi:hypothetical protein
VRRDVGVDYWMTPVSITLDITGEMGCAKRRPRLADVFFVESSVSSVRTNKNEDYGTISVILD